MPEQLVGNRTGLFTSASTPVPLAGVSIEAELSSLCARVVITQRYVNTESTPIEAVYLFPLDDTAAVCGFEAIVDGTLVVGEVKEREAAFRMYDDAIERGHGAYLLDEERADVFQASVGNLPPGKEALLKVTYVSELVVDGGAVRFTVPTTVAPRYAPAADHMGVGRPDAHTLNPPHAWRVPYGLTLAVTVTMPGAINSVASPSHPVSVAIRSNTATVSLACRDTALDCDFVLSIDAAGLEQPHAWVERADDGSEAVALALVPVLGDQPSPAEIVFLVDRSGSMAGTSIEEVRNALQLCLRSMIPGCAFNIVGFGSTHQALFDKSRSYDEKSLARASEHINELQADLGGTEILPALEYVLGRPAVKDLPRQVIVLTDGEVSNTDAVLEAVARHAATTRVFAFGIGTSPSRHLVTGIARAGRGAAEFIHPGERIEPKVVRQFGRLQSPALTNVRVQWDGLEVTMAAAAIPPVFAGDRLLLYGFVKAQQGTSNGRARLTADSPSGPMEVEAAIDRDNARPGKTVGALAARVRIRELEESPTWLAGRGSRQSGRKRSAAVDEIVALSTRYAVISRETSFVAIERRETPVQGDIQLRRIPIAIPRGWAALDDTATIAPMAAHSAIRHAPGEAMSYADLPSLMSDAGASPDTMSSSFSEVITRTARPWLRRGAKVLKDQLSGHKEQGGSRDSGLHALVKLQRADGSWELTKEFAEAIGEGLGEVRRIPRALPSSDVTSRAWATALALVWLSDKASTDAEQWRMLAAKAAKWLETVQSRPANGKDWVEEAATFLKR